MKVLYITRGPSPYKTDFFNELGKKCDLTVVFEMHPNEITDRDQEWCKENFLYFKGEYFGGIRFRVGYNYWSFDIFKWFLKFREYDYVIMGMYSTPIESALIVLSKICKVKYIISSEGGFIKKDKILVGLYKRFLLKNAELYLASGELTKKYLEYYCAEKDKIRLYPFTSYKEEDVFKQSISNEKKTDLKNKYGIKEKKVILGVGSFIHRKGWDVLIKADRYIEKDVGLYIVGGKTIDIYTRIIEEYDLKNIHFVEFKNKSELADYYRMADLFVLPTRYDIWGLVINEAMSYGLPVITTETCIAGVELIDNAINGYIVKNEDYIDLSEKINLLLKDEALMKKMGKNNMIKIQDYTIEKMAASTFESLMEI